jgi:arylsulfatase A-like enzyme
MKNITNILLFIADQHRADFFGAQSNTKDLTPNLDRLAKTGIVFDRALTPCPLCTPARASLFTGRYAHQLRGKTEAMREFPMTGNITDANCNLAEPPILTQKLQESGMHTFYAGKWHIGDAALRSWFQNPVAYDWKEYLQMCELTGQPVGHTFSDKSLCSHRFPPMSTPRTAIGDYSAEQSFDGWIAQHAIDALKARPEDKPFFGVCSFEGPHPPFKVPEPFYNRFDPDQIECPDNFGPQAGDSPDLNKSFYRQLFLDHGSDWNSWKKPYAVYMGFICMIDYLIGKVVDVLDQEGLMEDTLIIYCSDHGEMLGAHGLWHKMAPYAESVNIPLMLSHPSLTNCARNSHFSASLIDLVPTMLSAAGVEPDKDLPGRNLLASPAIPSRGPLFSAMDPLAEWHGIDAWRMAQENEWKLIHYSGGGRCLYNLSEDPGEKYNCYSDVSGNQDIKSLEDALRTWIGDSAPFPN